MSTISNHLKSYSKPLEQAKAYEQTPEENLPPSQDENNYDDWGYGEDVYLGEDEGVDGFEDGPSNGGMSLEEMEQELGAMEKKIKADNEMKPEVKKSLLNEIKDAQQQLGFARFKKGKEQENILLAIETMIPQLEQDMQMLPAAGDLGSEIDDLSASIQKDFPGEKQDVLEKLGKLKSKLDLNKDLNEEALSEIRSQFEDIQGQYQDDNETKKSERGDAISGYQSDLDGMSEEIKNSKIGKDHADALQGRIDELKAKLGAEDVNLDEVKGEIQQLQDDLKTQSDHKALSDKFNGLSSLVPNDGWGKDRTKDLAATITKALKNDNWGAVKSMLKDVSANHGDESDNSIRQLVGTLYYQVAGEDEEMLKKLLACIPTDVLTVMSAAAQGWGEENQNDYSETEAKKAQYCYYGTGAETADLIDTVITEQGGIVPSENVIIHDIVDRETAGQELAKLG